MRESLPWWCLNIMYCPPWDKTRDISPYEFHWAFFPENTQRELPRELPQAKGYIWPCIHCLVLIRVEYYILQQLVAKKNLMLWFIHRKGRWTHTPGDQSMWSHMIPGSPQSKTFTWSTGEEWLSKAHMIKSFFLEPHLVAYRRPKNRRLSRQIKSSQVKKKDIQ